MSYSVLPAKGASDTLTLGNYNVIRDNFAAGVPDIFTAKGSLPVASASDIAVELLAPSNTPALLRPDSSQSAGLGWGSLASAVVNTSEGTTSTGFTDLATVGPSVSATVGAAGVALCILSVRGTVGGNGIYGIMGVRIDSTDPANENATYHEQDNQRFTHVHWASGLTAGSHAFTLRYKSSDGGFTATFLERKLIVIPL